MDKKLIKQVICPMCRSELEWEIKREFDGKVIDGCAKCANCNEIYPIRDEVGIFLPAKFQNMKIWERSERVIVQKKEKVFNNKINQISIQKPSELLDMIRMRNTVGKVRNEDLYQQYMETIGMPDTVHKLVYLAQKCAEEAESIDYILDFASGRCLLAAALRNSKSCHIIISDINPLIVSQAKQEFEKSGNCTNLSFMVFDIKKSPFKDKSIHTVTTLLGLQNIIPSNGVLEEINRIADVFLNISAFLTEELAENMEVLKKFHITDVWTKDKLATITEQLNWKSKEI